MSKKSRSRSQRVPSVHTESPTMGRGLRLRRRRVDPVERVLNLLTLLSRASTPMSREQIVAEMAKGMTPYPSKPDTQRQLFGADKNTIARELGIEIKQIIASGDDAGQTQYFIDPSDMFLPDLDLTPEESTVLGIALGGIQQSVPQAGEALMKFAGTRPLRAEHDLNISLPTVVVRLTEATQRRRAVRLSVDGVESTVFPWRLLLNMGTWYLIAHRPCVEGSEPVVSAIRCATLDDDVEILDVEPCCPRSDISEARMQALVHDAQGEETLATVQLDEHGLALVGWDPRVREIDLLPEGGARVTVVISDPIRFRGWILGLGRHALIEGPTEVRDSFTTWLRNLAVEPTRVPTAPAQPARSSARPGPRPLAERLQRLLSILPWLHHVRSISVAELADLVGVDPEHLILDLQFASMCGVPPYTHDALFEFWVEDGRVFFSGESDVRGRSSKALMARSVKLTPRQAASVELALAGLEAIGFEQPAVSSLRAKLAVVVGESAIAVRISRTPCFADIQAAVSDCREIAIDYVNNSGVRAERVIQPRLIFVDHGETFLKADHSDGSLGERNFHMERILGARPTGRTFAPRAVRWAGRWDFEGDSVPTVVYVAPGNDWVLDRVSCRAKLVQDDGSIFLWVDVVSEAWLATLLARCGAPSCVVEPDHLRPLAPAFARQLLALYESESDRSTAA